MPTAVITGCNSGIGFCLAQVALRNGYKTYATSRTDGSKLKELKSAGAKISVLDVSSMESIDAFKKAIGDEPIHLLINNAGFAQGREAETLTNITPSVLQKVLQTNLFGPLFLTQSLLPNIFFAASASSPAQIAHMSTRAASIDDNSSGGLYAYRSSKAGLNMIGKSMSVDLKPKNVAVSVLHPGMINTPGFLTDPNHPLVVSAEHAAEKCWEVMMKVGLENTGKFWHRDGYELPW